VFIFCVRFSVYGSVFGSRFAVSAFGVRCAPAMLSKLSVKSGNSDDESGCRHPNVDCVRALLHDDDDDDDAIV